VDAVFVEKLSGFILAAPWSGFLPESKEARSATEAMPL
jgi:hypothetical protein